VIFTYPVLAFLHIIVICFCSHSFLLYEVIMFEIHLNTKCGHIFLLKFDIHNIGMTMGRGGDGFYLPRPHTRLYLPVTLLIFNGDEKLNLIPVPDGFGYPRPIPASNNYF